MEPARIFDPAIRPDPYPLYAAPRVNRDPERSPDPDTFDAGREDVSAPGLLKG